MTENSDSSAKSRRWASGRNEADPSALLNATIYSLAGAIKEKSHRSLPYSFFWNTNSFFPRTFSSVESQRKRRNWESSWRNPQSIHLHRKEKQERKGSMLNWDLISPVKIESSYKGKNLNRMAEQYDQYPSMLAGDFHDFFRLEDRRSFRNDTTSNRRRAEKFASNFIVVV